jgi:YidC/Oxa1 family membrane protein insertase
MSYVIFVYNLIFYQPLFNFLIWLYNVLPGQNIGYAILVLTVAIRIKKDKVNPFSSCLPLLIQFPFLIAVYQVFRQGLDSKGFELLYPFVSKPEQINHLFLGFIDLAAPSLILAVLAGAAQFWQTKMLMAKKPPLINKQEIKGSGDEKTMAIMNKQMLYFMPIFTVIIGMSLPAGLSLYWFVTTLLMALQQLWMFRKKNIKIKPQFSDHFDRIP